MEPWTRPALVFPFPARTSLRTIPASPDPSGPFLRSGNRVLSSSRPHPGQRRRARVGEGRGPGEGVSAPLESSHPLLLLHPHRRSASWRSRGPHRVFSSSPFRVSSTDPWLGALEWEDHSAPSWLPRSPGLPPPCLPLSPWRSAGHGGGGVPNAFSAAASSLPYKRRPTRIFKEACFVHARRPLSEPFPPGLSRVVLCPSLKPQTLSAVGLDTPYPLSAFFGLPQGRGGQVLFICRWSALWLLEACGGQCPRLLPAPPSLSSPCPRSDAPCPVH